VLWGTRRIDRRPPNCGSGGDGAHRLDLPRNSAGMSPATSVQTAVLRKKLVDAFPTRNPDEATSPRLLASLELALPQQRSDGLRARSKRIGRLAHCEVVAARHAAKIRLQLSQCNDSCERRKDCCALIKAALGFGSPPHAWRLRATDARAQSEILRRGLGRGLRSTNRWAVSPEGSVVRSGRRVSGSIRQAHLY
jgi:hypothetical protein